MHHVFTSLTHSSTSITNTIISAYSAIENVHKVTLVDLDKVFNTNRTNNNASI